VVRKFCEAGGTSRGKRDYVRSLDLPVTVFLFRAGANQLISRCDQACNYDFRGIPPPVGSGVGVGAACA
jgi:hypothetical protein